MGLAQEAQRVAAEFEYSAQHVNKAVKHFVKQMSVSTWNGRARMPRS